MAHEGNPLDGISPAEGYAGDVSVQTCWDILGQDQAAALIDVRTAAEWAFVGVPDLSQLDKQVGRAEWVSFPQMNPNPNFADDVVAALGASGASKDVPIFFLCRSGQRSQGAAKTLTAAGFTRCYNVVGGFEGDADGSGHRGQVSGWKVAGLPWVQS